MGCYGGPHMRRIIHLATGGVCWPRVGPGGELEGTEVRRLFSSQWLSRLWAHLIPRHVISSTRLAAECRPSLEAGGTLFQRLSMAIQRFNLVAFLGTFPSATEDEA